MSIEGKSQHLEVSLNYDIAAKRDESWHEVQLLHECLPEIDRDSIDLTVHFCDRVFRYPVIISALTGGTPKSASINEILARAAEHFGIGIELGSQSALFDSPELEYSYSIARKATPDAFLVANIDLGYAFPILNIFVPHEGHMP